MGQEEEGGSQETTHLSFPQDSGWSTNYIDLFQEERGRSEYCCQARADRERHREIERLQEENLKEELKKVKYRVFFCMEKLE